MPQPPSDQILHSVVDLIPGSAKLFGGFLPGKFACPMPQEMHVNLGRGMLSHAPRHFFDEHRSEEHTSELQSQFHLVCRLLLEKKKQLRSARLRTDFDATG